MSIARSLAFLSLLIPCLAQAQAEEPEEKPGLAALDIKASHGVPPELAQLMGEILLSELKASGKFGSVLGSSDMQAMLDMEQQKTALGCEEDSCLAQLGGALGVPYLLTASLGKLGESFVITVKIIEVDAAEVKVRAVENAAHEQHLRPVLAYLVGVATSELFGGKKPERPTLAAVAPTVAASGAGANWTRIARFSGFGLTAAGIGLTVIAQLSLNSLGEELENLEAGKRALGNASPAQDRRIQALHTTDIPGAETNRALGIGVTAVGLVAALSSYFL